MQNYCDICLQVSIFLRDKVQHNNTGRFVLPVGGPLPVDTEVPGKIRSALQAAYPVIEIWYILALKSDIWWQQFS